MFVKFVRNLLKHSVYNFYIYIHNYKVKHVHRCGAGGSIYACHAAGPGSIPGLDKFPG